MSELVTCTVEGPVARVTLERPEVRNALSFDTLVRLREVVASLAGDDAVRVVVVTGAGDKAFCAGADLKERAGFTLEKTTEFVHLIGDVLGEVAALPQPTIAALQGGAFGGGLELALACDLRVAARGVSMGLTETALAIIPGAGGTQRLTACVGAARAKELILSARRVDADDALAMGLVNDVVEARALGERVRALAGAIARCGPLAVRAAKEAIDLGQSGRPLGERLERERELYLERVLHSEDRLEALAAFREKREPRFQGR